MPIVAQRLREAKATTIYGTGGSASSAVASIFWYDMCLSAACAFDTDLCAWDCRHDYKQWKGWPDCVRREDSK